jgi:hypothetical protein
MYLVFHLGTSLCTWCYTCHQELEVGSDTVPVGGRTGYRTSQQNASMTIDNYAREVDSRCVAIFGLIQDEWVGRVLQLLACVPRPACKMIGLCWVGRYRYQNISPLGKGSKPRIALVDLKDSIFLLFPRRLFMKKLYYWLLYTTGPGDPLWAITVRSISRLVA